MFTHRYATHESAVIAHFRGFRTHGYHHDVAMRRETAPILWRVAFKSPEARWDGAATQIANSNGRVSDRSRCDRTMVAVAFKPRTSVRTSHFRRVATSGAMANTHSALHRTIAFQDEYRSLLTKHGSQFDERMFGVDIQASLRDA